MFYFLGFFCELSHILYFRCPTKRHRGCQQFVVFVFDAKWFANCFQMFEVMWSFETCLLFASTAEMRLHLKSEFNDESEINVCFALSFSLDSLFGGPFTAVPVLSVIRVKLYML